jgi:hypothetical protein
MKKTTWSEDSYTPYHYREKDQDGVDIVLEN